MPKKSQKFWLTGNKKRKTQSNPQTSAQPFEQSNSSSVQLPFFCYIDTTQSIVHITLNIYL